jgi:hypothetical protein
MCYAVGGNLSSFLKLLLRSFVELDTAADDTAADNNELVASLFFILSRSL